MNKKKVLILGGSSDIGISLINKLLKKNYYVCAHFNKNKPKIRLLHKKQFNTVKLNFNSINHKTLNSAIKKLLYTDFDIIINLIGYVDKKDYFNTDLISMINSLKVNALIPFLVFKSAIKNMKKKNWGRILNCSSIGVKFGGGKKTYNYSLSKHCSEFIPGIYKELAKKNILINNLRIGATDTKLQKKTKTKKELKNRSDFIPMKRLAQVDEISEFIMCMIRDKNSYMTNQTVSVSGGE